MASEQAERREFFRVKDRLLIEFREISHAESLIFERNLKEAAVLPGNLTEIYSRGASKKPGTPGNEFYSYLEILDRKLDTIIDLLSKKDDLFHSRYLDVTISGSGVQYHSDVRLEEGRYVELRILLPSFPNPRISALARVVRVKHSRTAGKENWETAMAFTAINEKDRDILINYIFTKEREYLRTKQNR